MRIEVIGSTKPDYFLQNDEALRFAGMAAGVCYMPHTLQVLSDEPVEKTMKRIRKCISDGHHSVVEHLVFNLYLENVPKILAMILNNEKAYATSERSARFTAINVDSADGILYKKWVRIFEEQIKLVYPQLSEKQVLRFAMENARYLISVFTPSTSMIYTVSLRQMSYIIGWMKKYIANDSTDLFSIGVKDVLKTFLSTEIIDSDMKFEDLAIDGLTDGPKNRSLSLFAEFDRKEEYGENYCVNYWSSFAMLAQAQRHRTLKYEMSFPKKEAKYYVPQIIVRTDYRSEWLYDIKSLSDLYPQGRMALVNERGSIDDFILKCCERLCGHAQLEIANHTKFMLGFFLNRFKLNRPDIYERLIPYSFGARCTFPNWECKNPCIFGCAKALKRLI